MDMNHIATIENTKYLLLSYSALDKSDQGEKEESDDGVFDKEKTPENKTETEAEEKRLKAL